MKVSSSKSRAIAINSFFPTNSIYLVVKKVLVVVYDLYLSSQLLKLTLTFLKIRKDILKAIFILISVNKKVFSKNRNFLSLSFIEKKTIIVLKVSSLLSLIF